jgi:molecular chaperone DnaJ
MKRDYYEVLDLDRGVGDAEIKRAFRKLARELHPDVNKHDPEAEEKFKEAAEAYEVLSDPDRRSTYDAFGHDGLRTGGWAPRSDAFGSFEDVLSAFFGRGDPLFSELFGFGPQGPATGGDVAAQVEVSLAEVLTGASREVSFEAVSKCEHCRGNGAEPGTPIRTCETCGGIGEVREVARVAFGQVVRAGPCPTCAGQGRIPETPCAECRGEGRIVRPRTWDVEVPPGIESGQRIRISGAGHAGETGGRSGDLYVQVLVAEDDRFERHGQDLVTVVELPATRAMLGGTAIVPTLDGEREVEVAAGAQPGEQVLLRGLGLPSLRAAARGDQHVVLDVQVPARLNKEQRELVERLDQSLDSKSSRADGGGRRRRRSRRGR